MSERMHFVPPEERGERPLPKTADFRYAYRGYWDEGGICRVRLFQAPQLPPVVLVSQLEENRNTSITNMAEYIAAEIGAKHFPHRFEQPEPFVWVEHYAYPAERDPALRETWSRVRFDSYTPKLVTLGGVMRTKLGTPRWIHVPSKEMARLIGPSEMGQNGGGEAMSCVPPRKITLPRDREAWRETREARRKVLAKVRARRLTQMQLSRHTDRKGGAGTDDETI